MVEEILLPHEMNNELLNEGNGAAGNAYEPAQMAQFMQLMQAAITTNKKPKIEPYTGSKRQDLTKWLENFNYESEGANWTDAVKFRKIPLYLSNSARDWYNLYVTNQDPSGGEIQNWG